jgi:hypothetical protein
MGFDSGSEIIVNGVTFTALQFQQALSNAAGILTLSDITDVTASAAEVNTLDITTPGTAQASKALVVDANKDIAGMRNLGATSVDAGASGTAGSVDVFPGTASKGKLSFTCDDQAGNTTVEVKAAAMAAARVITVPDPGAAGFFAMTTTAKTAAQIDTAISNANGALQATKSAVLADSVAADVPGIVANFNTLLSNLRAAGIMLPNP